MTVDLGTRVAATCTCPPNARVYECMDCPAHGAEAEAEVAAQAASEIAAESAWLRAAEYDPRMADQW